MAVFIERIYPIATPRRPYVSRGQQLRFYVLLLAVVALSIATWARGRGYVSDLKKLLRPPPVLKPATIGMTSPADGATGVALDVTVVAEVKSPRRGATIDRASLVAAQVVLVRTGDQTVVPATCELTGPSKLTLKPLDALEAGTNYTFYVGGGLRDSAGADVTPSAISFTTAAPTDPHIRFQKVLLDTATGAGFTCVAVGPDQRLYASSDDGRIFRFAIEPDGTLGKAAIFDSLQKAQGGPRLVTGFCFDPASTPDALILWVAHGYYGFEAVPDWTGKISRISGRELEVAEDIIINLPRSVRDHLTNQPAFGPDGALYFQQGSNSAYGGADADWGNRPERVLSASILRLDTTRVTPGQPLDARTTDGGGTYNPYLADAPLTIYASGVRVAYDLVWTDDEQLFAPTNGSSAGGNAPGSSRALHDIPLSEDDWLFRILPGRYYGHPNPQQGHYLLNGANPTAGYDFAEIVQYPVGTRPDRKWMPAAYSFGKHASANGIIQYQSDAAFGSRLRGALLVCRYNVPGDIAVLHLDGTTIRPHRSAIPGLSGLANPLDVTEDPSSGHLYVSEYGAQRITLLRATAAPPRPTDYTR